MLKRIYTLLISGTLLSIQASYAAPQTPTNIKKIITKKDKIIVIVRENGKDKEVVLSKEQLDSLKKAQAKTSNTKVAKDKTKSAKKSSTKKKELVQNKQAAKEIATAKVNKKSKENQYKVKKGDTLFSIALKFKVSFSDLTALNKAKGNNLIHPDEPPLLW